MAGPIGPTVSWSGNDHILSHSLSKTQSMVSFDSIPPENPETPGVEGAPSAAEFRAKHIGSQLTEPSGTRTCTSASIYPGTGEIDGSFVQHQKYFFKDGNITFLVRGVQR